MPMSGALPGLAGDLVRCVDGTIIPKTDKYILRIENKMRKNGWKTIRNQLRKGTTWQEFCTKFVLTSDDGFYILPECVFCTMLDEAKYGGYNEYCAFMLKRCEIIPGIKSFKEWLKQGDAHALRCDPSYEKSFFVLPEETWINLLKEM